MRVSFRGFTASPGPSRWRIIGLLVLGAAIAMRANNALRYRTAFGFDAVENLHYIERLMRDWSLPAPDAGWATAHPPLFYYLCAALGRLLGLFGEAPLLRFAAPLMLATASIAIALLALFLLSRLRRRDEARQLIAMGLLLYLPASIYTSAMLSEETLSALFTSLLLAGAIVLARSPALETDIASRNRCLIEGACMGLIGGLALLTKLSGVLALAAVAASWSLDSIRTTSSKRAALRVGSMLVTALAVGGWFYLRNLLVHGYLYAQDLPVHAVMFEMPPGERALLDYVRVPLATFLDPQLLNTDLLRSVWGSTYATVFFDGHRHFLPRSHAATVAGRIILVLALLPTAACLRGAFRGFRRALHEAGGPDRPMAMLSVLTLLGYVGFSWSNPWFVTLKGSYLLGLSLPFAWWASETLADWSRLPGVRGRLVWCTLLALMLAVTATFTIGPIFDKLDAAGLPWTPR